VDALQFYMFLRLSLRRALRACADAKNPKRLSLDILPPALEALKDVIFRNISDNEVVMADWYAERVRRLLLPEGTINPKFFSHLRLVETHVDYRIHQLRAVCERAVRCFVAEDPADSRAHKCALKALKLCKLPLETVKKCDPETLRWFRKLVKVTSEANEKLTCTFDRKSRCMEDLSRWTLRFPHSSCVTTTVPVIRLTRQVP